MYVDVIVTVGAIILSIEIKTQESDRESFLPEGNNNSVAKSDNLNP